MEWDREFRLVRWSPQAQNIFGWRADEVLGMSIAGNPMIHESDRESMAGLVERLMKGEEPRATGLTRNHRKDGETIWCEWYHSALLDDQSRIVSILSFVQDVSARIQAEERLQNLATRDTLTGLAEPAAAARAAVAGDLEGEARRTARRRDVHRSRSLQERQRHARSPHRGRAAEACHARACRCAARNGPAGAAGRRRVHGHRRGLRRSRGAVAHRAEAARRRRAAVQDRGERSSSSRRRSASRCTRTTPTIPTSF